MMTMAMMDLILFLTPREGILEDETRKRIRKVFRYNLMNRIRMVMVKMIMNLPMKNDNKK